MQVGAREYILYADYLHENALCTLKRKASEVNEDAVEPAASRDLVRAIALMCDELEKLPRDRDGKKFNAYHYEHNRGLVFGITMSEDKYGGILEGYSASRPSLRLEVRGNSVEIYDDQMRRGGSLEAKFNSPDDVIRYIGTWANEKGASILAEYASNRTRAYPNPSI